MNTLGFKGKDLVVPFSKTTISQGQWKFGEFSERSYFDPLALHIYCTPFVKKGEKLTTAAEMFSSLKNTYESAGSKPQGLAAVLKMTASLHEYRHAHDLLCTPYGIRTFLYSQHNNSFRQLFWASSDVNREAWIKAYSSANIDDDVTLSDKTELSFVIHHEILEAINLQKRPIIILRGHEFSCDYYRLKITELSSEYTVPCVFINGITTDGDKYHAVWAVNFTTLTECLAVMFQEMFLRSVDDELSDEYRLAIARDDPFGPYLPIMAAYIRAYKKHNIKKPSDDALFTACSRALFSTSLFHENENDEICGAGWDFVRLVDQVPIGDSSPTDLWKQGPDIEHMKDFAESQLPAQGANGSPYVKGVKSAVQDHLIKSLDVILEHPDIDYFTKEGFFALQGVLPQPPVVMYSDRDVVVTNNKLYGHMLNTIFWRHGFADYLAGEGFSCPVISERYKDLFTERNYPSGDICKSALAQKSCGACKELEKYEGPDCFWSDLLKELQLALERKVGL